MALLVNKPEGLECPFDHVEDLFVGSGLNDERSEIVGGTSVDDELHSSPFGQQDPTNHLGESGHVVPSRGEVGRGGVTDRV
jgi:hypothetical protein